MKPPRPRKGPICAPRIVYVRRCRHVATSALPNHGARGSRRAASSKVGFQNVNGFTAGFQRYRLLSRLLDRELVDPIFGSRGWMVLVHHHTIPVRVPARRAFSAAVGDAEQQPLVGFNSFLARSPAISCIPLAGLGAWSGQPRCHGPPAEHPQGCWDICEANGSRPVVGGGRYPCRGRRPKAIRSAGLA